MNLGALAWAGTGKHPGLSPEAILRRGGRQAVYRPEDLADLTLTQPVTLPQLKEQWLAASSAALALLARLPLDDVGCLHLDRAGKLVSPDPTSPDFPTLTRHFGSVKGAWPRIVQGESQTMSAHAFPYDVFLSYSAQNPALGAQTAQARGLLNRMMCVKHIFHNHSTLQGWRQGKSSRQSR